MTPHRSIHRTGLRAITTLAVFAAVGLTASASLAQSNSAGARTIGASVGYTDSEFNSRLEAPIAYPMGRVSASFSSAAATIDIEYAQSLGERDISQRDATGAAKRSDASIELEYRLGPSYSFLAGYSDTDTTVRLTPRDGSAARKESYATDGYHAGLAYSWQFQSAGALRFSYVWTRLDGELNLAARDAPTDLADTALGLTGQFSPEASGTIVRVDWTIAVSQAMALRLSAARYNTRFELREDTARFNLDQQDTRVDLGILIPF
jgi:hypothetical protein